MTSSDTNSSGMMGGGLRYLDVCAGISASTVAWKPLGWKAAAYSEIEAAPRAVLAHHYPDTPLHGDFTTIKGDEYGPIDLLVGGTPCQDFSVAGLRAGLDGDRGNLSLEFLRLADRARPRWVVWENVPGVLSIDGGRAFGAILGGLGELGYGFAYRVLDAQFFGVPQRRRRVFVVGCAGNWRGAAAVLSERHSLSGHPAPRRKAGKGTSGRIARSLAIRGREGHSSAELGDELANAILTPSGGRAGIGVGAALISSTGDTAHCLNAGGMGRQDYETETLLAQVHEATHDVAGTMMSYAKSGGDSNRIDNAAAGYMCITHALRGEGFDASEDGTGRGTPLVPVCFSAKDHGADAGEIAPTLRAGGHSRSHANAGVMPAVAFAQNTRDEVRLQGGDGQVVGALAAQPGMKQTTYVAASAVRRLTPRECERLQGFPDDYTLVPHRGKPMADGPRYKALGNSMAVPVMRWIGERIAAVDALTSETLAA